MEKLLGSKEEGHNRVRQKSLSLRPKAKNNTPRLYWRNARNSRSDLSAFFRISFSAVRRYFTTSARVILKTIGLGQGFGHVTGSLK